ncbi:ROK family transcriptional regulator [Allorhizobium borbori]|uniref:Putative NBD/HSP70 family sugar kinase n=1 Tax=Allorhizobium borbori TaxID=485907 RepID=A0A7W6P0B4_9HYPH|nr:ROK family transcriptional regulator [Allorhizobium borbori]MBB4102263.1 putative NBD/HSP70 family sugar kinase [Allorhizobium borbori]PZU23114.1 MAG: sugar kinase [Shinella sp.]
MTLPDLVQGVSEPVSFSASPGGANQVRVRAYNERLVLSIVRRQAGLSKAEIARLTGLSAQTVSVIMRALEKDGLLMRGEPLRGRVGQPSVPMYLNPDAVYSFGLKIGRRSADLVLMDFTGHIRFQQHRTYAYPVPGEILDFLTQAVTALEGGLSAAQRAAIAGIGIAAPFELWNWASEVGAPEGAMEAWRGFDLQAVVAARFPYAVYLQNDATSACGAELVFGEGARFPDFVYFYLGSFIGGGIVVNSSIFVGRTGTAGAIAPLPVRDRDGETKQLVKIASIFVLERLLRERGIDSQPLWHAAEEWVDFGEPLEIWIRDSAAALAQAIVAACAIIDFSAAIIDGGFPEWVRERLVTATLEEVRKLDLQGIVIPEIIEGMIGPQARAVGGASLPIFARYLTDHNVLFKEVAHAEGA